MTVLRVRNWDKWQSYRKDRGQPPWIKIHRELLRNWDFIDLTDAQRGQLLCIWMVAADNDGEIPDDARKIQRLCSLENQPEINTLISLGFLERRQRDANVTPEQRQNDSPDTEAEAEAETEYPYQDGSKLITTRVVNINTREGF